MPSSSSSESFEGDVTEVSPRSGLPAIEQPTPAEPWTEVDARPPIEQGTPTEITARAERSEPIRVISMKEPSGPNKVPDDRRALHVQLRSLAEVSGRHDTPVDLGHLAPPRDPRQARKRRLIDNALWGCVAIVLAGGIMLAIWLVAGR